MTQTLHITPKVVIRTLIHIPYFHLLLQRATPLNNVLYVLQAIYSATKI